MYVCKRTRDAGAKPRVGRGDRENEGVKAPAVPEVIATLGAVAPKLRGCSNRYRNHFS